LLAFLNKLKPLHMKTRGRPHLARGPPVWHMWVKSLCLHRISMSRKAISWLFGGFAVVYNELENGFVGETRAGAMAQPAPPFSVEQCHSFFHNPDKWDLIFFFSSAAQRTAGAFTWPSLLGHGLKCQPNLSQGEQQLLPVLDVFSVGWVG